MWIAMGPVNSWGGWGSFLCGVCLFSVCLCGFPLAVSHSSKVCTSVAPRWDCACVHLSVCPVMDWWPVCLQPLDEWILAIHPCCVGAVFGTLLIRVLNELSGRRRHFPGWNIRLNIEGTLFNAVCGIQRAENRKAFVSSCTRSSVSCPVLCPPSRLFISFISCAHSVIHVPFTHFTNISTAFVHNYDYRPEPRGAANPAVLLSLWTFDVVKHVKWKTLRVPGLKPLHKHSPMMYSIKI